MGMLDSELNGRGAMWHYWAGVLLSVTGVGTFFIDAVVLGSRLSKSVGLSLTANESHLIALLFVPFGIAAAIGLVAKKKLYNESLRHEREMSSLRAEHEAEVSSLRAGHESEVLNSQDITGKLGTALKTLRQKMKESMEEASWFSSASSSTFLDTYHKIKIIEKSYLDDIPKTNDVEGLDNLRKGHSDVTDKKVRDVCCDIATDIRNSAMSYLAAIGKKEECRVLIKEIISDQNSGEDMCKWKYADSFWDRSTYPAVADEIRREGRSEYLIESYGPLRDICNNRRPYFACSDLESLVAKAPEAYITPSPNWRTRYNAKIIVPIEYLNRQKNIRVVFGFISIDSMNTCSSNAFSGTEGDKYLVNLAKANADLLCAILGQVKGSGEQFDFDYRNRLGSIRKGRRADDLKYEDPTSCLV